MSNRKIAVYPGTFDPITSGHADILLRASHICDELILAISESTHKDTIFSLEDRCDMAQIYLDKYKIASNIRVIGFKGLLVNFAQSIQARFIIRGLRAVSDFEYEFQMFCMNHKLNPNIETVFLPASEKSQFISSRLVKEVAKLGGDISDFVIPEIETKLIQYYKK